LGREKPVKRAADFELVDRDGRARRGRLFTDHGEIDTPVFMPVGTQGTVKGLSPDRVRATGADLILGNTYHLYLRPGSERIERLGGLHAFSNWPGAMLTDSGGFQVFSLAKLRKISNDGVRFQSHLDGSRHEFTPEHSMDVQAQLGADIVMAFDECPALPATPMEVAEAVNRTVAWAVRCREHFGDRRRHPAGHQQALFGIVQGGLDVEERARCAEALGAMEFAGYAIGGLSVGEEKADMHRLTAVTAPLLPDEKPRYLMGVGYPEDILAAVAAGVDMFDCVLPTRLARHGTVLTPDGRMSLKNARFAEDAGPIEEGCPCAACSGFSRAYLRHLVIAREMLGFQLTTEHNLSFYQRLMQGIRDAVTESRFESHRAAFLERYLRDRP
jgi:queuine tRNA-ribosyltransferase